MDKQIYDLIKSEKYEEAYAFADKLFNGGDFDSAYEVYDEIYETLCEKHGRSSEPAYAALRNLAQLNFGGERYTEAFKLFNLYLEFVAEKYGKIYSDYYDVYEKTATILEYMGELGKAADIRNEILAFCLEEYGGNSAQAVTALGGLAWNTYVSGKISEALELFLQQYDMALACEEYDESRYCFILQNIGRCYDDINNKEKATEYFETAYKAAVKAFGEKKHVTMSVLNDLAGIYSDTGRKAEAIELKEKLLATAKEVLGEDRHDTTMAKLNLGEEYSESGNWHKGKQLTEEAYEWFVNNLGYTHRSTMIAMGNLANAYSRLGNEEKSLELRERLSNAAAESFGETHPMAIKYFLNMGYSYKNIGQLSTAVEIADEACRRMYASAESDPQFIMYGLGVNALFNMEAENYDKALARCDEFFDFSERCVGVSLYDLETIYYVQSNALSQLGRHEEALTAAEQYRDVATKIYGDATNPYALDGLCDYARILYKADKLDEALELVEYTVRTQEEHGYENPPISTKLLLLSDIYTALGRYDEAEQILDKLTDEDENNVGYLYSFAVLQNTLGNKAEAVGTAEKCVQLTAQEDPISHKRRRCERLLTKLTNERED